MLKEYKGMKYFITCIVLAVFLVGCDQKPKFSINEKDNIDHYANNAIFTKLVTSDPKSVAYKFNGAPESAYGINTRDLDIIGGYVFSRQSSSDKLSFLIYAKGKANFDKLMDRITKSGYLEKFEKRDGGIEKDMGWAWYDPDNKQVVMINYNPILDTISFSMINY